MLFSIYIARGGRCWIKLEAPAIFVPYCWENGKTFRSSSEIHELEVNWSASSLLFFCICFMQKLYFLDSHALFYSINMDYCLLMLQILWTWFSISCSLPFSAFYSFFMVLSAFGFPDIYLTAAQKAKHLLLLPSSHEHKAAGWKHTFVLTLYQ